MENPYKFQPQTPSIPNDSNNNDSNNNDSNNNNNRFNYTVPSNVFYVFITAHGNVTSESIPRNNIGNPLYKILSPVVQGRKGIQILSRSNPTKYHNNKFINMLDTEDLNSIFEGMACPKIYKKLNNTFKKAKHNHPSVKPQFHINQFSNNMKFRFNNKNKQLENLFFIKLVNIISKEQINITAEIKELFGSNITLNGLYHFLSGNRYGDGLSYNIPIIKNPRFVINACRRTVPQIQQNRESYKKNKLKSKNKYKSNRNIRHKPY